MIIIFAFVKKKHFFFPFFSQPFLRSISSRNRQQHSSRLNAAAGFLSVDFFSTQMKEKPLNHHKRDITVE